MPFFRCGGSSLATLSKRVVNEKIRSLFGENLEIACTSSWKTGFNLFGVSSSTHTYCWPSAYNNTDPLRKFFEYYSYNVSVKSITSGYPNVDIIQGKCDDPEDIQYPGSSSGTHNTTLFQATYSEPSSGILSFEKKSIDYVRSIIGDSISISYSFNTNLDNGIVYTRTDNASPKGEWYEKLKKLFEGAGYSNFSNPTTISGNNVYYMGDSGGLANYKLNIISGTIS